MSVKLINALTAALNEASAYGTYTEIYVKATTNGATLLIEAGVADKTKRTKLIISEKEVQIEQ